MINSARGGLMRWRWLVVALVALTVVIAEVAEHLSKGLDDLDPDFIPEILIFGIVFPLAVGILLNMLAQTTTAPIDNIDEATYRRVLIVENELVLGAGIESLLSDAANLELIGSAPSSQLELIDEIRQSQSEVVILDMATYLANPVSLLTLLENYPKLRVVVVSADDNLIHIYDKHQVLFTEATDLTNVIQRGDNPRQSN